MKKNLILVYTLLFFTCIYAQEKDSIQEPEIYNLDEIVNKKARPLAKRANDDDDSKVLVHPESGKADYLLYKVISHQNDTILIDTTLTLANDYKMNFLKKDLFGLSTAKLMTNSGATSRSTSVLICSSFPISFTSLASIRLLVVGEEMKLVFGNPTKVSSLPSNSNNGI